MAELYHHQILGAKWGQKNGPPYPLKPGDHSETELKANPALRKQVKMAVKAEKQKARVTKLNAKLTAKAEKSLQKGKDQKIKDLAKNMTKEELEEAVARLDKEKRYVDLQKSLNESKKHDSWIRDAVKSALKNISTQAITAIMGEAWNTIVTDKGHPEYKVNPKKGQKDK